MRQEIWVLYSLTSFVEGLLAEHKLPGSSSPTKLGKAAPEGPSQLAEENYRCGLFELKAHSRWGRAHRSHQRDLRGYVPSMDYVCYSGRLTLPHVLLFYCCVKKMLQIQKLKMLQIY